MEKNSLPISAWLYGPPGTGKTAVARKIAAQFTNSSNRVCAYVNCWERPTLYSVAQALCEQLKILGADAQNTNVKLDRLRQKLKGKTVLIILDEIDRPLPKERGIIIYQLLQLSQAGLFCITTSPTAFINLDDRVKSKLSPVHIRFPKYSTDQIGEILEDRARLALSAGTYSQQVLDEIAELAEGDAASALKLLLRSALNAEKRVAAQIAAKDIPPDKGLWRKIEQKTKLESLNYHQLLIYRIVKSKGQTNSSKLRQLYMLACHKERIEPIAQRTFTKYLNIMIHKNVITAQNNCSGRVLEPASGLTV